MHIVLGMIVGAALSITATVVVTKLRGEKLSWKTLVAAGIGGALGGAFTAATFGAGGLLAASTSRAAVATFGGSTIRTTSTQFTENLLNDRPVNERLPEAVAVGVATGGLSFGVSRAAGPLLRKALPKLISKNALAAKLSHVFDPLLRGGPPNIHGQAPPSEPVRSGGLAGAIRTMNSQVATVPVHAQLKSAVNNTSSSGFKNEDSSRAASTTKGKNLINIGLGLGA